VDIFCLVLTSDSSFRELSRSKTNFNEFAVLQTTAPPLLIEQATGPAGEFYNS